MGKAKERSIMDYLFHVGNAGVILKLGGQWVGIDVFTGREIKPYQPLPETLEQKLLCDAGCPEIGLLVVTHSHRDHFHPQKVSAYLKTHSSALVLAGDDILSILAEAGVSSSRFLRKERLSDQDFMGRYGALTLYLLSTEHMGNVYRDVRHYSVLLQYQGQELFVSGDAKPDHRLYGHLREYCRKLSVLIAPFPALGLPGARKCLLQFCRPDQIFLVHFPSPGEDMEGWIKSTVESCRKMGEELPYPVYCLEAEERYPLHLVVD